MSKAKKKEEKFMKAINKGDETKRQEAIDEGTYVNKNDKSLLEDAKEQKNKVIEEFLIKHVAKMNAQNSIDKATVPTQEVSSSGEKSATNIKTKLAKHKVRRFRIKVKPILKLKRQLQKLKRIKKFLIKNKIKINKILNRTKRKRTAEKEVDRSSKKPKILDLKELVQKSNEINNSLAEKKINGTGNMLSHQLADGGIKSERTGGEKVNSDNMKSKMLNFKELVEKSNEINDSLAEKNNRTGNKLSHEPIAARIKSEGNREIKADNDEVIRDSNNIKSKISYFEDLTQKSTKTENKINKKQTGINNRREDGKTIKNI